MLGKGRILPSPFGPRVRVDYSSGLCEGAVSQKHRCPGAEDSPNCPLGKPTWINGDFRSVIWNLAVLASRIEIVVIKRAAIRFVLRPQKSIRIRGTNAFHELLY